jgi:putative transposase
VKLKRLRGKTKRKYKNTTTSEHQRPRAENLVKQNFTVTEPNKLWLSDITYISTLEGWLYFAVTLDAFSRKAIGWSFSDRLTDTLVLNALRMAKQRRTCKPELIHHSDQGSQYASLDFRNSLQESHITQSMSGKGNCYDKRVLNSRY